MSQPSRGDEALLKRSFYAWQEYQNISVTGVITYYEDGKLDKTTPFKYNFTEGKNGSLPPFEMLFYVPNPGEPLSDEPMLVDRSSSFDGKLGVFYRRRYISETPHYARLSTVFLSPFPPAGGFEYHTIHGCFHQGLGQAYTLSHANFEKAKKNGKLEILGQEKYLGVEATRVRATLKWDTQEAAQPLELEALVALEPTFQVLKYTKVSGGPEGFAESVSNGYLKARVVESVKVMNNMLVCNRVRYPIDNGATEWRIEIEKVEPLEKGYVGMWDYSQITGAVFTGTAEKATRAKSKRQKYPPSDEYTQVPYTEAEAEKIRQYILSKAQKQSPRINWLRVGLWVANGIAATALGWALYRRFIRSRTT